MSIKISISIEPSWTTDHWKDEIEIEDEELRGPDGKPLTGAEREKAIHKIAEDEVSNTCPWGWEEIP